MSVKFERQVVKQIESLDKKHCSVSDMEIVIKAILPRGSAYENF